MATDKSFIDFLNDQIKNAGNIFFRKMFGEYAMYCDGKVVALICDNQVFMKKTEAGRAFIGNAKDGFAYPGAKAGFLIEDMLENREQFSELVRITAKELPEPKPKKRRDGPLRPSQLRRPQGGVSTKT
jgi:TfoX/Sxy family transcriptional regulator of competence genes